MLNSSHTPDISSPNQRVRSSNSCSRSEEIEKERGRLGSGPLTASRELAVYGLAWKWYSLTINESTHFIAILSNGNQKANVGKLRNNAAKKK